MPEVMQKFFDAKPESVGLAREFATSALAAWGLDGPAEDIRLCVSELASNALAHGSEPGHGSLQLPYCSAGLDVQLNGQTQRC